MKTEQIKTTIIFRSISVKENLVSKGEFEEMRSPIL